MIITKEIDKLFNKCYYLLGGDVRKVELQEEHYKVALSTAIEDYSEILQNFLIESQWSTLYGLNLTNSDIAKTLSIRSLDYADKYAFAYSKQVGLQSRGHWELKKDFVEIEAGRQVYEIPANREINEVLYFNPPVTDAALFANYGGFDQGFAGGMGQIPGGNMTSTGYYIAPAYDVLMMAQDINLKQRLLRGDMTYKVTAGANGTKLLHLTNLPQSRISFAGRGKMPGGLLGMVGCQVWYHYYDTTGYSPEDCIKDNPDVILLPDDVPLEEMSYEKFNAPTKVIVRQLFIAEAKKILAMIRGKFSGQVGAQEAQLNMDYNMLLNQARDERAEAVTKLMDRLNRMRPESMMEKMAKESEDLNRHLKHRPLDWEFI